MTRGKVTQWDTAIEYGSSAAARLASDARTENENSPDSAGDPLSDPSAASTSPKGRLPEMMEYV
jgi:hypothetical protein